MSAATSQRLPKWIAKTTVGIVVLLGGIVITDLCMPHVDGRKVGSGVRSALPDTPVILLTGWGQRLITEGDIPSYVDLLLSKPPKVHELRQAFAHSAGSSSASAHGASTAQVVAPDSNFKKNRRVTSRCSV